MSNFDYKIEEMQEQLDKLNQITKKRYNSQITI